MNKQQQEPACCLSDVFSSFVDTCFIDVVVDEMIQKFESQRISNFFLNLIRIIWISQIKRHGYHKKIGDKEKPPKTTNQSYI